MTTREHSLASPGNAWAPGHRIEHFELQQVASSRSGAIVYRGWDHRLARAVAVKEFLPARLARRGPDGDVVPAGTEEAVLYSRGLRAFVEEARLLAHADHPSLVRVVELIEAHGTAYRVMPWHDGVPLADLRRGMAGPPDEAAVRRLLDELLGALGAWHRSVGVHGAVDPGQVMLLDDDRALLLGPGLARRIVASDAVEALMRQLEPCYAPPELIDPQPESPPGPWSDFHALSLTVRYAITGLPPPPAGGLPADPLGPAYGRLFPQARPLPDDLAAALDRAASPRIADRPQVAAQWRAALALQPAPPPPDRPPLADSEEATASLIQRVIDSIPDLPPPLARHEAPAPVPAPEPLAEAGVPPAPADTVPEPDFMAVAPEPAFGAEPRPGYGVPAPPRRSRRALHVSLGVLAVVLAAAGYSVWDHYAGTNTVRSDTDMTAAVAPAVAPLPQAMAPAPSPEPAPAPVLPPAAQAAPPGVAPAVTPSAETVVTPVVPAPAAPALQAAPAPAAEPPPGPPPQQAPQALQPQQPQQAEQAQQAPPNRPIARTQQPPPARPVAAVRPRTPEQQCSGRTQFALYRCMQQQCAKANWARHAECVRFKRTDSAG